MELSSLLNRFSEPETLKMAKLGRELRAKGVDVIDLSLGEPDFDTPQHIKDAAIKAINDNWSHYTPVAGFLDLREAVCTKLKRDNNLDYTPDQIITSTGAKQSLANALLALVDEGDEVIIPTPYWVTYSELVKIARGKVVEIRTTVEAGFKAKVNSDFCDKETRKYQRKHTSHDIRKVNFPCIKVNPTQHIKDKHGIFAI